MNGTRNYNVYERHSNQFTNHDWLGLLIIVCIVRVEMLAGEPKEC